MLLDIRTSNFTVRISSRLRMPRSGHWGPGFLSYQAQNSEPVGQKTLLGRGFQGVDLGTSSLGNKTLINTLSPPLHSRGISTASAVWNVASAWTRLLWLTKTEKSTAKVGWNTRDEILTFKNGGPLLLLSQENWIKILNSSYVSPEDRRMTLNPFLFLTLSLTSVNAVNSPPAFTRLKGFLKQAARDEWAYVQLHTLTWHLKHMHTRRCFIFGCARF